MHSEPADPHAIRTEFLVPDAYPALRTVSAGHLFRSVIVPRVEPGPAEFVYIPCSDRDLGRLNALAEWNLLWECGHIRPDGLASRVPVKARQLADRYPEQSFRFAPLTRTVGKASAYEPLRSLLPLPVLKRFGLQPRVCVWPSLIPERAASSDEVERLSRAVAFHLWPLICSGSPPSAFSPTEPISLLAHGLDFWLPYLDLVIQERIKAAGRVPYKTEQERREVEAFQRQVPPELDADLLRPCYGINAWDGEDEAREATIDMIDMADARGRLRGLLDAVRANRVEEDFSTRWSNAREDFERKLYRKRNKVRVTFVEIDKTPTVFAPDTEVDIEKKLLWQNLFAVLDAKERHVIVCLRNGSTTKTEIAQELRRLTCCR
ncbi:MAG: hypothetical protein WDO69_33915 [Pseudomonadota bacterium]